MKGEEIPAKGTTEPSDSANPGNDTPTESTKPDGKENTDASNPQTGDNSNILLWFAVLFVSGAGIFGTTVFFRKKKRME